MVDILKKDKRMRVALLYFVAITAWWFVAPSFKHTPDERFLGDPSSIYFLIAVWGSLMGLRISQKWGGLRSVMGKAALFITLGLSSQLFGQIAYGFFPFVLHQSAPYPSLGDLGYFASIPFYIAGIYFLARASGLKLKLQAFESKIQAVVIPLIMLGVAYYFFLQGYKFDWSNPIRVFLDFGYPLGDAIYISFAIITYLLSRGILGGMMKNKILFILFALVIQFTADFTFLYQSSKGTYHVGQIDDYLYFLAYFVMTVAILRLDSVLKELKRKS